MWAIWINNRIRDDIGRHWENTLRIESKMQVFYPSLYIVQNTSNLFLKINAKIGEYLTVLSYPKEKSGNINKVMSFSMTLIFYNISEMPIQFV